MVIGMSTITAICWNSGGTIRRMVRARLISEMTASRPMKIS